MTNEELNRAKELKIEISVLQTALMELHKCKMFSVDDGGCGGYITTKHADSFLAELHVTLTKTGVDTINSKLHHLQIEFDSL
jgi:hypothetical protein